MHTPSLDPDALSHALRSWLRLSLTPGVGNEAARRLLACFGSPQAVFEQSEAALRQVVSAAQAQALLSEPPELPVHMVRTQQWLALADHDHPHGVRHALWTLGDAAYPDALLQLADPPLMLYVQGQTDGHLGNAVSVVGSRNPTPQGAQTAEQFSEALSAAGLCVVSGMALGIDGAAHRGALRGTGTNQAATHGQWRTVAIVGTGLDRVYPRQHQTLARDIAQHGVLISEYLLGTPPLAQNFPKRNRLIAALGLGTLVVEAALGSGSLITARQALEQGREVFALPGSIHSPQSKGCHALIREGAVLVESVQDVLAELPLPAVPRSRPEDKPLGAEPTGLLALLGHDPIGLDALQQLSGLGTAELQAELLALELQGLLARQADGLFQRLAKG